MVKGEDQKMTDGGTDLQHACKLEKSRTPELNSCSGILKRGD